MQRSLSSNKQSLTSARIQNLKHAFFSSLISFIISTVLFWSCLFAIASGPFAIIGIAYFLYIVPLYILWTVVLLIYAAMTKRTLNYKILIILPFIILPFLFAIWAFAMGLMNIVTDKGHTEITPGGYYIHYSP